MVKNQKSVHRSFDIEKINFKWSVLIIFFIISIFGRSQTQLSVEDEPKLVSEVLFEIETFNQKSSDWLYNNSDSAIAYARKAVNLSRKYKDPEVLTESLLKLAKAYEIGGMYESGIKLIYDALHYKQISNVSEYKASLLVSLGELNSASSQYNEAIINNLEALRIYRNKNDTNGMARCHNRLASNYLNKEKYFVAVSHADTSNIFSFARNNRKLQASNYEILGTVYSSLKDNKRALNYFEKGLEISKELNDIPGITNILNNIAINFYNTQNYSRAVAYGEEAFDLAKQTKIKPHILSIAFYLAKSYAAQKDFKNAYAYSEIAEKTRMELIFSERDKQISVLNRNNDYERQQQEIEKQKLQIEFQESQLKQKRVQNILLITWGVVLLVLFFLVNRTSQKLKQSNQLLENKNVLIEEQRKNMESQATKYKEAYKKLKELDQFKEAMTHMLVHDLKNPLNVLINIPELGDFEEKDDIISHTSKQMLTLVMNMLDIQKFENDKMELNKTLFPFDRILEAAEMDVQFLANHKNISFKKELWENVIIMADKELLVRVVVNLLTNAIKFSPSKSEIQISSTEYSAKFVKVSIKDKGVGVPKESQKMIFEKYVHLQNQNTDSYRSTGLGLTFCKMAVEAHGGVIGVTSEKGEGAEFWFTLPYQTRQVLSS